MIRVLVLASIVVAFIAGWVARPTPTLPDDVVEVTCAFRSYEDASVTIERDDARRFDCMERLRR